MAFHPDKLHVDVRSMAQKSVYQDSLLCKVRLRYYDSTYSSANSAKAFLSSQITILSSQISLYE